MAADDAQAQLTVFGFEIRGSEVLQVGVCTAAIFAAYMAHDILQESCFRYESSSLEIHPVRHPRYQSPRIPLWMVHDTL